MAPLTKYCFLFSSALAISIFNNIGTAIEEEKEAIGNKTWLTVSLSSLLPSSTCTPFTGSKKNSSLEVIQRYGPCCEQKHGKIAEPNKSPSHIDILSEDQARVNSIQSKLSKRISHERMTEEPDWANTSVRFGLPIHTSNYIVTVGLGSPQKNMTLIVDTGSDITWTQCLPCYGMCYNQQEPIFDPSKSTTYSQINCPSSICAQIFSTGRDQFCFNSSDTCIYEAKYLDTSFSSGFLSRDTLTITATNLFNNFLFGCGHNNHGITFGGAAGILGLNRDHISFIQQTANVYNRVFSYCLPSTSSSVGHLTFGDGNGVPNNVQYTPMFTIPELSSFYGISITGIIVGEVELTYANSMLLSSRKAIIDSGTMITRLPPSVYSSLRSEFRRMMLMYPMTSKISILDTCYDLSGHDIVKIPKISLVFGGGVNLDLGENAIVYAGSEKQVCLAFAPNMSDEDVVILGNVQQRTIDVVYDLNAERIGFGPLGGCN